MSTYRYTYTRRNLHLANNSEACRDFEGSYASTLILFMEFLNEHNRTYYGEYQYWCEDFSPILLDT